MGIVISKTRKGNVRTREVINVPDEKKIDTEKKKEVKLTKKKPKGEIDGNR